MKHICPHCKGEIPPRLLKEWAKQDNPRAKFERCTGIKNGLPCERILTARQRREPCPGCGHNNWRIEAGQKKGKNAKKT